MAVIFLICVLFFPLLLLSTLFLTSDRHRSSLPPGPKDWFLLGHLLQLGTKPHQTLRALAKSHGSAGLLRLRLGTVDVIVISSASAAAKCFRGHDAKLSSRPPNSVGKHITYNFQDIIMAPYGPRWRMLRKLCSMHLFSSKSLDGLQHVRDEEAARLVLELASGREAAVDVGGVVNTCVTNALARVLVGRRVIVEGEEAAKFKEMTAEMARLAGEFNVGDFVPGIDWLDLQGLNKKMKKVRERFGEFLEKIIDEHRSIGFNHQTRDFLSLLIEMKDSAKEEFADINIKALLQDMFIAGTETTSITVEWILAELIRHPKILARAQHELDSIVGRDRLINESDLSKFSFLHAIVKETFRLHPPVPLSVPRMTTEDSWIDGYLIPKGVTLLINIWAIGRDPVTWPSDPNKFNPDRFGPNSPHMNVDAKGNDFELIPFGAGRRMCAGMNLGLRMVHLMTAILLHSFDWALPDDRTANILDMEESCGATMHKAMPLVAKAVPRLSPQAYL
ncbi:flavonoid 3'-monooxygenase-like [Phalaenopsis equestris]|uniref:flavonoid 3'-monooxygenase-like n=1 Tax=Phalaenopsis equestris TaxID=78828 RepID=UPI0009E57298|nr:flavonoid 3'-monooxygenase-like [Phalaenopsis equestris]